MRYAILSLGHFFFREEGQVCLHVKYISSTSYGCVGARMDLWAENVNLGTHTNINYHHHLAAGLVRTNRFSTAGLFLLAVLGQVRELTNLDTGYLGL